MTLLSMSPRELPMSAPDPHQPRSSPTPSDGDATRYPGKPADPDATGYRTPDEDATRYRAAPADPEATGYTPTPTDCRRPAARRTLPCLFGDYELLEEIARGGMGVVYKARQRIGEGERLVALKMIREGRLASSEAVDRFLQEARAAATLDHPGIVPIYDIGECEERHYFTMPLLSGGSLADRVREGPLPPRLAARVVQQVAEAVQFAHEHHVIHRDLKPGNILLTGSPRGNGQTGSVGADEVTWPSGSLELGDGLVAKVTDFGLARTRESGLSVTGEALGTPSYMPPEQARGQVRAMGPTSDVYGLGAVLYCLLTGRAPFQSSDPVETMRQVCEEEPVPPRQLNPAVPRDLAIICLKCLQKEPSRRYDRAAALVEDLRRWQVGKPITARQVGRIERSVKWVRRRPVFGVLIVLLITVGLAAFVGVTWAWRTTSQKGEQARTALYHSRITRSQLHWRLNDLAGARRSLKRSWEDLLPLNGRPDPRGWEWYYLDGLYHSELLTVFHKSDGLRGGLVYHPDGRWFASLVTGTRQLTAWDRDGAVIFQVEVPEKAARLAIRPDGAHLAVGETEGVVSVRPAGPGRVVWSRQLHRGMVASLAYSPDNKLLASAGHDGTVHVVDAGTGKTVQVLSVAPGGRVHAVAFRPNGRYLVTGDDRPGDEGADSDRHTYRIRVWSARADEVGPAWQLRGEDRHRHKSDVYEVLFSPDGRRLATAGADGNIRIWELRKSRPEADSLRLVLLPTRSMDGHGGAVLGMDFSPDGRYLAYGGSDGTTRVWAVDSGVEQLTFRSHTQAVEAVRFSPDGRCLATCCPGSGLVKVWDMTRHPEYATLARTRTSAGDVPVWDLLRGDGPRLSRTGPDIEALGFTPDGSRLVSVTVGGAVQTWDADSGVLLAERTLPLAAELITPAVLADLAPGGRYLAARARDDRRVVRLWDVQTGREVRALRNHHHPVFVVRFSPDGKLLATCACDRNGAGDPQEGLVWDVATGGVLGRFQGKGQVYSLAFSPDGARLAAGCADGRVWLLDWKRGTRILDAALHRGEVTAVAIRPDGKELASAGRRDHTLRLWDLARAWPRVVAELEAPKMICSLAYSPVANGRRLAGISRDSVRLWDVQTRHEALTLRGAPQRYWDPPFNPRLAYSPDGTRLAGTNWDESISVWEASLSPDEDRRERRAKVRRRAAQARAAFWHLQEALYCLRVKNLAAAQFHLERTAGAELSEPLQKRREMLKKLALALATP
jgi:WD40 repeat protein